MPLAISADNWPIKSPGAGSGGGGRLVNCQDWQSLVVNEVSVASMCTTAGFLVSALSTSSSPAVRFQ